MEILVSPELQQETIADVLLLPYWKSEGGLVPVFTKKEVDEVVLSLLETDLSKGDRDLLFSYQGSGREKRILLINLGVRGGKETSSFREIFAKVAQFCRENTLEVLRLIWEEDLEESLFLEIVDGLCMANYSYDRLKKQSLQKKPSSFIKTLFFTGGKEGFQEAANAHLQLMRAVDLARDLVNGNADEINAGKLVSLAQDLGQSVPLIKTTVLGKEELEAEDMGLILAVNKAAAKEPALILMEYKGDPKSSDTTAIIGKGVTFDTGGLNLKPTGSMETMKADMAGAGAVLGIMQALSALGIKKNVVGVIAAVENAVGYNAYKPGDVYMSHAEISVEITNTDAEGRLILADALSFVQKQYKPNRIIDMATLTGGIVVAIGEEASGLFSNSPELAEQVKQAARDTGERVWEMPLFPEYDKMLSSRIADIKNAGASRRASPCQGAAFLKRFIFNDTPWVHLDIAGTAYLSETTAYNPSYATGVGVKLMISFLQAL